MEKDNRREEEVEGHGVKDRLERKPKKVYVVLLYMMSVMESLQSA